MCCGSGSKGPEAYGRRGLSAGLLECDSFSFAPVLSPAHLLRTASSSFLWTLLDPSPSYVIPPTVTSEDSCHELSPPSLGEQARERWRQDSGSLAGRWGFRCGGLRLGMKEDGVQ
ncbi:unnamed protein product [Rangifer tarandus platyrhynchus]|uniref:Uncharacterized protein n=1 Tax=Rangifer tarandus platyrhynchus TaxID=3082113 RepID=A0AC59YNJ3_RANTA